MTRTTDLEVHHNKHVGQLPEIISPRAEDVFPVDLDSPAVINCTAVVYSDFDEVFWLIGKSFVERNESLPIYYNTTNETSGEQTKIKASLVIRKVSEEDLTKRYTCKLDSTTPSSNVTISLARRARPFSSSGVLRIVGFILVMVVTLSIIYVKLKIDIALFLRDTLGCYSSTPDGKSYDAYLMSYKSDTDTGLNEEDRRWLEKVLEDEFGYNLCLYDRDVLPGEAVAEAVLGCTEQSRRVVLIPCCPDPGPGSGLLSAIHAALVERQTHLVLIKTEATEAPSGSEPDSSLPEVLQLLSKAGHSVTWKGLSSQPLSSSFWKQLRYHLPAPQHPKTMAVPTDLEC
uniref:interleukin-18 receptor 1-like n=1 Tax=Centroberyx gerrardi TaxID=166262 RepID=UPI003AACBB89